MSTPEIELQTALNARIAGTMDQDTYLAAVDRWAPLRGLRRL